jgi:hypothetical protein
MDSFDSPPVADAGPDQTVTVSVGDDTLVTLDGSGSTDPNANELFYRWEWQVNGQTYEASGVSPQVTLPVGENAVSLTVSNGFADSAPDEVQVTVKMRRGFGCFRSS